MSVHVLVTGADGFVGRNLCASLALRADVELIRYDVSNTREELSQALAVADVVFHLAGVNRPTREEEFKTGNADLTKSLCDELLAAGRSPLLVLSSSVQAELDNPYGASKRQAELAVDAYARRCDALCSSMPSPALGRSEADSRSFSSPAYARIYRLPNVFGKWCRPNYNSAVATWCHNIARDLPIQVRDPDALLTLVYVDDVVAEFLSVLSPWMNSRASEPVALPSQLHNGGKSAEGAVFKDVVPTYTRTLGQVTDLLHDFHRSRASLQVPDQADAFSKKLYATYLAALPEDQFSYPLKMNVDARGSFTEFLKSEERGQVSVNISKPGVVKGNHWHHTKVEKFLVVRGKGVIRFRRVGLAEKIRRGGAGAQGVLEYIVSDEKLEVVDIPPGFTHNIENIGDTDMVTVMWASEPFDPEQPDTFFEKV